MNLPTKPIQWALIEIAGDPMAGIADQQFEIELWVDPADHDNWLEAHLRDLRGTIEIVYQSMSGEPSVIVTFDFELEARIVRDEALRRGLIEPEKSGHTSTMQLVKAYLDKTLD